MLVLFAARTNKRFKLLMSSAACLGQRQPIASRLPGRDELSALDAAVHYADDRLRAASKERSLIMSCLADEMRVPLVDAVVHMQRFEILAQKELSEKARGYLTVSKSSVDKIIRLLDDLVTIEELDIGKVDLKVETCNASDIAADAISAVIGLAAEKEISIVNLCPAIDVEADKLRIVQVLINYLANAVKFSQKHTNIQVNCKKLQNHVRFYVTDEGPGLDGETCKHVFERYYQGGGEPRGQGYGLGLAICRLIVLSHGGRIGVESEVGTGSTFWFELPIA
jgi:signal transduction histidine kinase